MNNNFSKKIYSTFIALVLMISFVTTPLSAITYEGSEADEQLAEQENTEESNYPNLKDIESVEESESTSENNTKEVVLEEDNLEGLDHTVESDEQELESETNDDPNNEQNNPEEQPELDNQLAVTNTDEEIEESNDEETEIVEFKHDRVRDTVRKKLGIESENVTILDMENLEEFYLNLWDYDKDKDDSISLKGLEHAVNLETLSVMNVNIEDTKVIEELNSVEVINLYNTNIEDLSVIKDLTQLKSLNVAKTNVSDISALEKLTELKSLSLESTNVSDISALEKLTELEFLNLDFTNVSDISVLKNLNKIISLGLGAPNVTDISVLEHLQELFEVALYETNIKDIKVLRKLPKLRNAVLDLIDVEAYDFETLDMLLNNDAIIGVDAFNWYIEQLNDIYPENEGYKVDEEKAQITAQVKGDSHKLSVNQVNALIENDLTIVLEKAGVTTSIPASVFARNLDVEIKIENLNKVTNSFSDAYKFTITQGNETISEFEEHPITLAFKVNAENANNVDHLQVYYLNETTNKWENIGGKYNAEDGTVTGTTDHFSTFAVFEAEEIDSDNIVNNGSPDKEVSPDGENDDTAVNESTNDEVNSDAGSETTQANNTAKNIATESDEKALLPNTATSIYTFLFLGLALLLVGVTIFAIRRVSGKIE
ncbi:hypothetical protein GGQ92_002395 [Gracilibacillus halotolerans]|uniref:LPXTG-motif cell wall anchor domain-containing protein n=1 Tax=Gracilibacillus halotolerans TaxID=74386 RepID=A0A841RPN1_9BACI|nr:leucine-rich repeat domain-containing protein [Gracilibacillus halotolerans]MBB6513583.1 hypothetical protein [Gracilibacillus halotolerans]